MVYKYLLLQIHSSDSFLWVGFISCINLFFFFKKNKLYGPFLLIWFNYLKGTGETLYFLPLSYHQFKFPKKVANNFNLHILIVNSEKYALANCTLSINGSERGGRVCTFINFNFHGWNEVEIRFSNNPQQKEIIWHHLAQEKKVCNLQIR